MALNPRLSFYIGLALSILVAFLITGGILFPILHDGTVVQDDFRQSCFWFWQFWDPELFKNDFFVPMYASHLYRTPLLYLIYKSLPLFTNDLLYFTKLFAFMIAIATSFSAYLFFDALLTKYGSLTKATYQKALLAFSFSLLVTTSLWCTDHVSAAHARSFIWLGVTLYMYLKLKEKNLAVGVLNLVLLMISPNTFLVTHAMEFFYIVLKKQYDLRKTEIKFFLFNTALTAFMYLVLFKDIKTQGVGTEFTVAEMKMLPEFNPGGRHPIFGSSLADGSWWTNEHWGIGIGYLPISQVMIWAFIASLLFFLISLIVKFSEKTLKSNNFLVIFDSLPAYLFYAGVSLYFAAQILFPKLYLPSRYVAIPSLLLSLILLTLIIYVSLKNLIRFFLVSSEDAKAQTDKAKKELKKSREATLALSTRIPDLIASISVLVLALFFWMHFKNFYHTRYVSISPEVNIILSALPKDSLIAGHPLLPDLNTASITSKRKVFVDYERSMAYTHESLAEIRRRNEVALQMTYATSKEEFVRLAKENGITHYLAHAGFYTNDYLSNPVYMKPYDQMLYALTHQSQGFFVQRFLQDGGNAYTLIEVEKLDQGN